MIRLLRGMRYAVIAAFVLVLVGWAMICARHSPTRVVGESKPHYAPQGPSRSNERKSGVEDYREVMCWGDSMTEGMGADVAVIQNGAMRYDASYKSYPEILNDLCGLAVFNCGVSGATSEEIVAMREDTPFDDEGSVYDVFDNDVVEIGREHTGDILVVEIGSNGGWDSDYHTLIQQYWRIINYSGCEDFIVVGDTDDPGTSLGDEDQEAFEEGDPSRETAWEQALRAEFGDHFINMRLYLLRHGLEVCGLQEGPQDAYQKARGCISHQLRADWTHLNSYGYYAKAYGIYEQGIALGYWGSSKH